MKIILVFALLLTIEMRAQGAATLTANELVEVTQTLSLVAHMNLYPPLREEAAMRLLKLKTYIAAMHPGYHLDIPTKTLLAN